MRLLTLAEENRVVSEARTKGNSDASTIMSPFAHVTRGTPTLQLSTPRLYDHSGIKKTVDDIETTYISMKQISESLKEIVQSTQYAAMSADRLLHQKVAQIYQDLSKAGIQIQQIKSSTARFGEFEKSMTAAASNGIREPRSSKTWILGGMVSVKAVQLSLRFSSIAFPDSPRMTPARQSMNFK